MQQRQYHQPTFKRHGITGTQIVLIMAVLAIGSTTLTVILNRFSTVSRTARCQFNLQALQTGFTNYAGKLKRAVSTDEPAHAEGLFATASADLYINLLSGQFVGPHHLICSGEKNSIVEVFDPDENPVVTADNFRADIDATLDDADPSWSNLSYANRFVADINESSEQNLPRPQPANTVRFGDRGPAGGVPDPASYANQLHGTMTIYEGNFVFADGHVITITHLQNQPGPISFQDHHDPNSGADNIFAGEDIQAASASEPSHRFLGIFRLDPANPQRLIAIWD